ncbi:MAG TPA: ubiquinone biosynthesis protein [Usitatibacter sp.]|nr:ubiquinone biosynthesis protein [Usitatibacter sp.]
MPGRSAAAAINHVLRSAPLAMQRLAKHAGRTARFNVGPLWLALTVQPNGEVAPASAEAARDLDVRIPPRILPRLAARDEAAWGEVWMEGNAQFAQEVSFVARNLEWDVEEDLSRVVGDIAAHRIVSTARSLRRWGREAGMRLAQGAAEYWTEESPLVASRVKIEDFARDVAQLRDAVERLERRVEKLG